MTPTLFFDLETLPDVEMARRVTGSDGPTDEVLALVAPPKGENETHGFLKPAYHQVVSCAIAVANESGQVVRFRSLSGDEKQILTAFWHGFKELLTHGPIRVVTHNGRRFDIPVAVLRALKHGISVAAMLRNSDFLNRYKDYHVDIMDWLSFRGSTTAMSQNELATLFGVPGKLGVDGGDVADMLQGPGGPANVDDYCTCDVGTLVLNFGVLAPDAGWASAEEAHLLKESLLGHMHAGQGSHPLWSEFLARLGD